MYIERCTHGSVRGWRKPTAEMRQGGASLLYHNRGSKYVIGSIKDLRQGDTITYTTKLGTRTYQVDTVETIDNNDWSYLQSTMDNRLTITTCLADHPESRVCVQAVEVFG